MAFFIAFDKENNIEILLYRKVFNDKKYYFSIANHQYLIRNIGYFLLEFLNTDLENPNEFKKFIYKYTFEVYCKEFCPMLTSEPGNFKKARTHLNEVIKKEKIEKIVIGLPLQLDGVEGKRAASTRRFINDFIEEFGSIEVIYQDERYTTIEAKERLMAYGYKQAKIDQMIDAMSAVIILEDYLRKEKNNG